MTIHILEYIRLPCITCQYHQALGQFFWKRPRYYHCLSIPPCVASFTNNWTTKGLRILIRIINRRIFLKSIKLTTSWWKWLKLHGKRYLGHVTILCHPGHLIHIGHMSLLVKQIWPRDSYMCKISSNTSEAFTLAEVNYVLIKFSLNL